MLIVIDSQIWIYCLDPNAKENTYVLHWFEGERIDGGIFTEKIILNAIIPIEVAHNFFRHTAINIVEAHAMLRTLFRLQNLEIQDIYLTIITGFSV